MTGHANENLRKLLSADDSGASSVDEICVCARLRLNLDDIIIDHGLYAPFTLNNNFEYILTLPAASKTMKAQTGETVDGYSLVSLELEYETIENVELADRISQMYTIGKSLG